jgi:hypothetical protein
MTPLDKEKEKQKEKQQKEEFEHVINVFRSQVMATSTFVALDGATRLRYIEDIKAMSEGIKQQVAAGKLTWQEAATQANRDRNIIMEAMRKRSTPAGKAFAEKMKPGGATLESVVNKNMQRIYPEASHFDQLSPTQKGKVFQEVVERSGSSRANVTSSLKQITPAARGLFYISISASAYNIATAEDKVQATKKEGAILGSGIAGGAAGGALAGLACGPGAPVCVTIGAFVGGAAAALGASYLME